MQNPWVISIVAIIGFVIVCWLIALAMSGGRIGRLILAKKAGWKTITNPEFAEKVQEMLSHLAEPEGPPKLDGTPLRVLTLLQREGRLLDFLMEDIESATDDQVGVGVREIHQKCQKALKEHLTLAPVMAEEEGDSVEVKNGFDPSAIQLLGNVSGEPPFKGTLLHSGWQVKDYDLPQPAEGVDDLVIHPAEVEIQ